MAIQIPVSLVPQSLSSNTCYPSEQARLVDFVAHINATLPINFTSIIVSPTAPGPDDRDKLWAQVDGNNQILGINTYANGAWNVMFPPAPYVCLGEFRFYDPSLSTPPQTALQPWFPCDGSVTGVPDMRGRFIVGTGQRTLPPGSTDTNTNFTTGLAGGSETLALAPANICAHSHTLLGVDAFGTTTPDTSAHLPRNGSGGVTATADLGWVADGNTTGKDSVTGLPNPPTPAPTLPPYYAAAIMQWRPDLA